RRCMLSLSDDNVKRAVAGRSDVRDVPEIRQVQLAKEMLSSTKQDRRNGQMHFVDQTQGKVLANHGSSTADPDVFSVCRIPRSRQSRLGAIGNKMEYRVPFHRKVGPWVMREHKDGRMVWRIVAPPAFPEIVLPWTANGSKH